MASSLAWLFVLLLAMPGCDFLTAGTVPGNGEDPDAPPQPVEPESPATGVVRPQAQPAQNITSIHPDSISIAGGVYYPGGSVETVVKTGIKVLVVIAQTDFHYGEYVAVRDGLQEKGHTVVVAAPRRQIALPQPGTATLASGSVMPDRALNQVEPDDYGAMVLVGGWGAVSFFSAFEGDFPRYARDVDAANFVADLVQAFIVDDKPIAAIGFGQGVLAWLRLDEMSPLQGKNVAGSQLNGPECLIAGQSYADGKLPLRYHLDTNSALVQESKTLGNPASDADDIVIDGWLLTAAGVGSAQRLGRDLGTKLLPE